MRRVRPCARARMLLFIQFVYSLIYILNRNSCPLSLDLFVRARAHSLSLRLPIYWMCECVFVLWLFSHMTTFNPVHSSSRVLLSTPRSFHELCETKRKKNCSRMLCYQLVLVSLWIISTWMNCNACPSDGMVQNMHIAYACVHCVEKDFS